MKYARLDSGSVVVELIDAPTRPDGCVLDDGTARIGAVFDGWTFRGAVWTSYEFLNRFTTPELDAILAASRTDPVVLRFLSFAQAANEIDSSDPVTISGIDYLVSAGLLGSARSDEILQK